MANSHTALREKFLLSEGELIGYFRYILICLFSGRVAAVAGRQLLRVAPPPGIGQLRGPSTLLSTGAILITSFHRWDLFRSPGPPLPPPPHQDTTALVKHPKGAPQHLKGAPQHLISPPRTPSPGPPAPPPDPQVDKKKLQIWSQKYR